MDTLPKRLCTPVYPSGKQGDNDLGAMEMPACSFAPATPRENLFQDGPLDKRKKKPSVSFVVHYLFYFLLFKSALLGI